MRGGSRSKSTGAGYQKDFDARSVANNANMTFLELLQDGCFEKDLFAYCSNRLTEFSCVYWLDPESARNIEAAQTLANVIRLNQTHSIAFSPHNNRSEIQVNPPKECYHDLEPSLSPLLVTTQILMPCILALSLVANAGTFIAMRKLSKSLMPIAYYLCYIAIFDFIDLCLTGSDMIAESYTRVRLVAAAQILNAGSCQIVSLIYNVLWHTKSTMYIGMSIDTWRFARDPIKMFSVYKKEWTRNVFILACALFITLNGQFFWTFDLNISENKILHQRQIKRTLFCGFSIHLPPNTIFMRIIWPLLDHFAGEIFPMIFSGIFGVLSVLAVRKYCPSKHDLARYLINFELVMKIRLALIIVVNCYCLFTIPHFLKDTLKYSMYVSQFTKSNSMGLRKYKPASPHNLKGDKKITLHATKFGFSEVKMEFFEYSMRYISCAFIMLKFAILCLCIPEVRTICLNFCRFKCLRAKGNKKQNTLL